MSSASGSGWSPADNIFDDLLSLKTNVSASLDHIKEKKQKSC